MADEPTTHYVRLNRTPFTEEWEIVKLGKDGRLITRRWPLHPDDAALLERHFGPASTDGDKSPVQHGGDA